MVKKIKLSQGQWTTVDDEDYEWLNQWKWYAQWDPKTKVYYAKTTFYLGMIDGKQKNKSYLMHRLITGATKGEVVDHINHNTLKNEKENLRRCSVRQNAQNRSDKTSSKYPGVSWDKQCKKWRAYINIEGKRKWLKRYDEELEAAKVYEKECRKLGEELVCKLEKNERKNSNKKSKKEINM